MMARQKKDSVPVSLLMEKNLAKELERYCKETRLTKTAAIEKAIQKMLEKEKRF